MAFPKNLTGAGAPTNGINAVHTLTTSGSPSSGTISLKKDGRVWGAIAHNADASAVQAVLDALYGTNQVVVAGTNLAGGLTLTYSGSAMRVRPQTLPTIDSSTWNVGTVTIASATAGVQPTGGVGLPTGSTYVDLSTGITYANSSTTQFPSWVAAGNVQQVVPKTANYTVLTSDAGTVFTNEGAVGAITVALPTATVGLRFSFFIKAAQELRIDPNGSETIALPNGNPQGAAGKYISANGLGEGCSILCVKAGQWDIEWGNGTWDQES